MMMTIAASQRSTGGATTPAAPTVGVVDDSANTFDWTNSPSFTDVADYEYTLNGGSSYANVTVKPLVVGDVDKAIGQVGVRVKAVGSNPASSTLYNASAFNAVGDYTPFEFAGAVNQEDVNLSFGYTPKYRGFATAFRFQDKGGFAYREGLSHLSGGGGTIYLEITEDGGFTWDRQVLVTESGIDTTNCSGGNTANGTVCIFHGRYNTSDAWVSNRVATSFDGCQNWTFSSDLPVYPGVTQASAPYGKMFVGNAGGTLYKQGFYGGNSDMSTFYIYTLESTDLLSWGNPKLVASGPAYYECDFIALGGGKVRAAVRKDNSPADKDILIYDSEDYGETWTFLDKAQVDGFDLSGASPYWDYGPDPDEPRLIATWRGVNNYFSECTMPFGASDGTGLLRFFMPGLPSMDANNIDYGYLAILIFGSNDEDNKKIGLRYGTSPHYIGGTHYTDVYIGPIYRKKISSNYAPGTAATGADGLHNPATTLIDEIPVYDNTGTYWQMRIRETANHDVHVVGTFTGGNTSGTYRRVRIDKYNSSGAFVSTMHTEDQANTDNTFDFTYTASMTAGERIAVFYIQDSGSTLSFTSTVTITKV